MKRQPDNFLDYVPHRLVPWEIEADGRVCLLKEKTKRRWLKKLIDLAKRSQHFRIHLDELGSGAWLLADGRASVLDICRAMEEKYGERVAPAPERVSRFIALMGKNGFMRTEKTQDRS